MAGGVLQQRGPEPRPPPPPSLPPSEFGSAAPLANRQLTGLLQLALGVVVVSALYFARDVLIPITLAVLLCFVLSPVVSFLQKRGLWKAPSVLITVAAAIGVIILVGTVMVGQASLLAQDAPHYVQSVQTKIDGLSQLAAEKAASVARPFARMVPSRGRKATSRLRSGPSLRAITTPGGAASPPVLVEIHQPAPSPLALAERILTPTVAPLAMAFIVIVMAVLILLQQADLRDRFIRVFGATDLHRTTAAMDDAARRMSRYFLAQLAVNTTFGVIIGLGLYGLGVPSAGLWGVLAGLLRFIPYVGTPIAAVLPVGLAAAVDTGWIKAAEVATFFTVIEMLAGAIIEPKLYGNSTGLSPMSVVVAAVFWGWMWGPVGLLVSTPLTLCLVVLGRYVKSLEFLEILLGDRPALSPVDSCYQRLLANRPEEVVDQAGTLLGELSLTAYYDSVAVNVLRLTADDVRRGSLDRERAGQIVTDMLWVISELKDISATPTDRGAGHDLDDWSSPGAILCVAGRGILDSPIAAMLAQLLVKAGLGAEVDGEDPHWLKVRLICVCYLDIVGVPARMQSLVRRLRARAPQAKILISLWQPNDLTLSDHQPPALPGIDFCAGTLHDAVLACEQLR